MCDVGIEERQPREAERVLQRLHRQPQARAAEEPRGERVEELAPPVPDGSGRGAEAEPGGDEVDVGARARQGGGQLVVVRRRERRWVGEDDAHGSLDYGRREPADPELERLPRQQPPARARLLPPRDGRARGRGPAGRALPAGGAAVGAAPALALERRHDHSLGRRRRPWLPAGLGGAITRLNQGLLRSAISGQANAILLAADRSPCATIASARSATEAASGGRATPYGWTARRREPARDERLPRPRRAGRADRARGRTSSTTWLATATFACSPVTSTCVRLSSSPCPAGRSSVAGSTMCSCAGRRRPAPAWPESGVWSTAACSPTMRPSS